MCAPGGLSLYLVGKSCRPRPVSPKWFTSGALLRLVPPLLPACESGRVYTEACCVNVCAHLSLRLLCGHAVTSVFSLQSAGVLVAARPRMPGAASETLLTALAQPKEREKLLRLEQELTRLVSNPSVDRLDMQPMSAHNRALVAGVAAYFGLRFVVVPADETAPGSAPHEGERLLPVWLGKCEETQMPAERLASLVPLPEEAAPVLRQDKVQLMRRAGGGANGKSTKAPEQLTAAEEQARHKDREDAYAAARQRIFGSAAQGGDGAAGGDASPRPASWPGGTMNNLSMGGHVADDLSGCINHLSDNFADELATVVFSSLKPFSSGLHKKFCKKQGYCGSKGKRKNDL